MNGIAKRTVVTYLVVAAGALGQAAPSFEVSPANPTSLDVVSITLSGTWGNSCVPEQMTLSVMPGDSLWIDVFLPGWDAQSPDEVPVCLMVLTDWSLTNMTGPLAPGTYHVYARYIRYQDQGTYEWVGQFQVTDVGGGSTTPGLFAPGQRVVLLEDAPPGGVGLKAGHVGTVICCDSPDCAGSVLVSWDLWTDGSADAKSCVGTIPEFWPPNSILWVNPQEVAIGSDFSSCGTIRKGLEGCVLFDTGNGKTYNVLGGGALAARLSDPAGRIGFGDYVRVRGLLHVEPSDSDTVRICPRQDGDIYHPIVSLCAGPAGGCCPASYHSGDRVVLLVSNPTNSIGQPAVGLFAGATGSVICCDHDDPLLPVFVSWDGWTNGTNTDSFCDPPIADYSANSGWWMTCAQIAPLGQP